MRTVVEGMAPGIPADAVSRIVVQSEGIPLYAVETVRMLLDRGLLERDAGVVPPDRRHRRAGDPGDAARPGRCPPGRAARGGATGRCNRRPCWASRSRRRVWRRSAACEPTRSTGRSRRSPARSSSAATAIRSHRTSDSTGSSRRIARTIAYETLSRRDRKAMHLAAAEFVAELGDGDELIEVVAAHRLDAYRLLPDDPDAAEIRDGAVGRAGAGLGARRLVGRTPRGAAPFRAAARAERTTRTARARLLELAGGHAARDDQLERASELFTARPWRCVTRGATPRALRACRSRSPRPSG